MLHRSAKVIEESSMVAVLFEAFLTDSYPRSNVFPRRVIATLHRICREELENLTIATRGSALIVQRRPTSGPRLTLSLIRSLADSGRRAGDIFSAYSRSRIERLA